MLIAAFLIIAKKWKQPRFPQTDEWINKMMHNPHMEYYLSIKINYMPKKY